MPDPGSLGRLVLVGTPIGALDELPERARAALAAADVLACEDTRKLRWLLREIGVPVPPTLVVVNDHTEEGAATALVAHVAAGRTVAVVSDAGMPGVADPGARVVRAAIDAGVAVDVVNGPSAFVHALLVSGLPMGRFAFEGFLPRSGGGRRARLDEVAAEPRTSVLYEAPHRVAALVADLAARCGPDRPVALCRELTKTHEEVWRGPLGEAVAHLDAHPPRGEFVVVLGGAPVGPGPSDEELAAAVAERVAAGSSRRDAAADVAARFGVPRNRVYGLPG